MQPNLGQGGCMAIEDSYQLILELKKVDMRNSDEESQLKQISESLNRYQSKRMFRVKTVHKVSRLASETLYTYKLSLDFGLSKLSNIFGVQITNYAIDITRKLMQWCCQLFMIWMIAGYGNRRCKGAILLQIHQQIKTSKEYLRRCINMKRDRFIEPKEAQPLHFKNKPGKIPQRERDKCHVLWFLLCPRRMVV
ncbi:zeaxanthin epoxidase, chloroplastic-like isoform X3 [Apium graveolens]